MKYYFYILKKQLFQVIMILTICNVSNAVYGQDFNDIESAREKASEESIKKKSPSFVLELGRDFSSYSEKNWSKTQVDSFILAGKKSFRKKLDELEFYNSTVIFAENKKFKGNHKSIYLNGSLYGLFGSNEATGITKICDLFFNNPRGKWIENKRFHMSENYFEEYTDEDKSKSAKYRIPDSFFYFNYLFKHLSSKGSLFVIFYDKEMPDFSLIVNKYKNIIGSYQTKKNNLGLIVVDQNAFPKTFKSLATNEYLVNPDRYRKDFYVQLWNDGQVMFDFYEHRNNKLNELKKILNILSNVSSTAIKEYANAQLLMAKFKDLDKVVDKESLLKYMDSKDADLKVIETFSDAYVNYLKIKADIVRNRAELSKQLRKNNGLTEKTLGIEFYYDKIIKNK